MFRTSLGSGPRLRYPLGYWNANGAMCGHRGRDAALDEPQRALDARCAGLSVAVMPGDPADPLFHLLAGRGAEPRDRRRLPAGRSLAGPALDAGDAGDRRRSGALPAAARGSRLTAASPTTVASQTSVDQGPTVLLILLAGIALTLALFALLRRLEARGGRRTEPRRRALPRARRCSKASAIGLAVVAIAVAIVVRRPRLAPVLELRPPVPDESRPALLRLLRRRPARLLAGRDRRLRGKAAARPRRRHLSSSRGTSCARST